MLRVRSVPVVLVVLSAVLGSACASDASETTSGDAELTADEQRYADALADDLADTSDGLGVTAEEGDCMATVVMAELGTGPFEDAGVEPKDLSGSDTPGQLLGDGTVTDEQATNIYDAWGDCVDLDEVFVTGLAADYEADADAQECLRSGLAEDDLMRAYMTESFTNGDELDPSESPLKEIVALITSCTATSDGSGGALVDSIAQSLAAGGTLTADEAQCLAQSIVDKVGADELLAGVGGGDLSAASPELQQAIVQAIAAAAGACDVPLSKLGG